MILGFHHEVPICNLSTAVLGLFSSAKNLFFNGQVTRAGVCVFQTQFPTINKMTAGLPCKTLHLCFVLHVTQQFVGIQ